MILKANLVIQHPTLKGLYPNVYLFLASRKPFVDDSIPRLSCDGAKMDGAICVYPKLCLILKRSEC